MADRHQKHVLFSLVLFSYFVCSSFAYQFIVGGRNGWIVNPSENYNHWAQRNRFQVNDTVLFKYKSGSNSVLVVKKDDYDQCNIGNPILKLDDGNSVFKFDRSGPFYFISGDKTSCDQGQKLIIVVLAIRRPPLPPCVPPPTGGAGPAASPLSPPASQVSGPSPAAAMPGSTNSSTPEDAKAPPPRPRSSVAPADIPSIFLMSIVSVVLSVILGGFVA